MLEIFGAIVELIAYLTDSKTPKLAGCVIVVLIFTIIGILAMIVTSNGATR